MNLRNIFGGSCKTSSGKNVEGFVNFGTLPMMRFKKKVSERLDEVYEQNKIRDPETHYR